LITCVPFERREEESVFAKYSGPIALYNYLAFAAAAFEFHAVGDHPRQQAAAAAAQRVDWFRSGGFARFLGQP
jgi:hypothetical protein